FGVCTTVNGHVVRAGRAAMMEGVPKVSETGTVIHVSVDGEYSGHVVISDTLKNDAKSAVEALKSLGVERVMMLTGDAEQSAKEAAMSAGIDEYHAGLLPSDKVEIVKSVKGVKAFAGDGINDAPVLACADVGIAMGALGSDAAVEAADVVIMDDDLMKIPEAVKISRRCMRIVRQNVYGSIGVKMLCLALGALGIAGMRLAVFADVGVLILAVINSIRPVKP
ncbi:MAG: HAD-IC family P-type ATPase, partial [Synergistaceae bacterium]|nr:HAD-IC family P-type ATPase [Synergistaceae bacterium]